MIFRSLIARVCVSAGLMSMALIAAAQSFTQADLEKMVKELEVYSEKFPEYAYPIKAEVVEKDEINAYATVEKNKDGKWQGKMVVFTGFVKFCKGDIKLIRACVAHEVSHLAKGHCTMPGFKPSDLDNLWTRQQEFEADITGASILQKAGYSKNDMINLMLALDELDKGSYLGKLTGDHASGKARAAQIEDNPIVLKSHLDFEVGLAFMENRNYMQAMQAFDRALVKEPKLNEAYTNSAQAAIMFYFDNLPLPIRETWFRPDFGPMLAPPPIAARDGQVRDEDRQRWEAARTRISKSLEKNPNDSRALELAALILILEPDGKAESLKAGTDLLQELVKTSILPEEKLRFANNAALGLQRMGKLSDAVTLMLNSQKGITIYNPALAENLGINEVPKGDESQNITAASVMATWLDNTSTSHPRYGKIRANYVNFCKATSLKVMDFAGKPIYLCKVMSINDGGTDLGMFEPYGKFATALGKPDGAIQYDERYPDLMEVRWRNGLFAILTERDEILRVTSYSPGAYINLRSQDSTLTFEFKVTVGMTTEEFTKVLNPDKAGTKNFIKGGSMEEWRYWPGLNMGVLFKDGKVAGITATASK